VGLLSVDAAADFSRLFSRGRKVSFVLVEQGPFANARTAKRRNMPKVKTERNTGPYARPQTQINKKPKPKMIWQVGNGSDEAACANALGTKNGVVPFTSKQAAEEDPFKGLTKQSTLQIVANLSIIDGTAGNLTPEKMAQFLIWGGLKEVDHISLVICNSAVELKALKGQSFAARFRKR
jgi:hypothetical protein